MLTLDDRAILQHFVAKSAPGDAYLRRARILLLTDEGWTPERIAPEVGVTAVQARNFLRAFQKQGLALFPPDLFKPPAPFGPDEPLAEAARQIMRQKLTDVRDWLPSALETADETAVHELRKTIRQLRAAARLFAAQFTPGLLTGYRRKLRKLMRLSNESRDLTVFCAHLAEFSDGGDLSAAERAATQDLLAYWRERQTAVNADLQQALAKGRWQKLLTKLETWAASPGAGISAPSPDKIVPTQTRHLLPALVYGQLAEVRAFDGRLTNAPLTVWHELRIHFKRLRYLLEFFEPLLGGTAAELIADIRQMQDVLGELNDGRVALEKLDSMDETALATALAAVALYRAALTAQMETLQTDFLPLWRGFNQAVWRQKLAAALWTL
jgi:CHAD domain-containing protein